MTHEIVTIGGGSGSPVVHEALLQIKEPQSQELWIDNIGAIAAVFDSGRATGVRRQEDPLQIAYSDAMRILFSLAPPELRKTDKFRELRDLFYHRSPRNTVLGQEIFHRFYTPDIAFAEIQRILETLGLEFNGRVIPSAVKSSNIAVETERERFFLGEHHLDEQQMSKDRVKRIYLEPSVTAYPPAIEVVQNAKLIILSCGSILGSVLVNALPEGLKEAFARFEGELTLVTNLTSERNVTHDFTPLDFIHLVEQYVGRRPTSLIVPQMTRAEFEQNNPGVSKFYEDENSYFLGWDQKELYAAQKEGVKIITHKATTLVEASDRHKLIRHDPGELANSFVPLLPRKPSLY